MDPMTINEPDECHDADDGNTPEPTGPCHGEIVPTVSKSGCTRVFRCEKHADSYYERMDKLEEDLQSRYPGYDNPNSSPPDWLDPSYAGESWHDDY